MNNRKNRFVVKTEDPPLQFSILRLAIALGVFGVPFAFLTDKGEAGIFLAILLGSALSLLALILARRDRHRVVDLILFTAIGGLGGFLFAPSVTRGDYREPTNAEAIPFAIAGALLGAFICWIWNLATRAN